MNKDRMKLSDLAVYLAAAALVLAVVTRAGGAVIDRDAPAGSTVEVDGRVVATVGTVPVLVRLPGDDVRLVPSPSPSPSPSPPSTQPTPPTTQPTPPVPPQPLPPDEPGIVRRQAPARTPVFFRVPVDARWDMPPLPDGTPARSYYGPFFAWAFDQPGTYRIAVTPGNDIDVVVTAAPAVTVLRLPPGRQTLNKTLTSPTWVVAADPANPPIISGGITVAAPNCYLNNLIFDGDTNVNRSSIEIANRGSAYVDRVEFRNIGSGIRAEVPGVVGVVARHVRGGSGVKKYPFCMFAGHDFALFDFAFVDYRGLEHCIRIDANNGVTPRNGIIAYGIAARANDNKEPVTIRRAEDFSIHNVTFRNGYAVRLFYAQNDYLTGSSRNVYVRYCIFDSVPLYAYWWGSDGLNIGENVFRNLGGDAAIHYNGGKLRNVREWSNHRDGAGAMHRGDAGPGYVYVP